MYNEEEAVGEQEDAEDEQEEEEEQEDEKLMKKSRKKSKKDRIEPAIIDLINTELQGLACHRRPFIDTFQNFKSGVQPTFYQYKQLANIY